jgi:hypothetical protein
MTFEPDAKSVLEAILPAYIHYIVFQTQLGTRASEQSARMVAMKSATDNAKSLVKDLRPRIQQGPPSQHHERNSGDCHCPTGTRLNRLPAQDLVFSEIRTSGQRRRSLFHIMDGLKNSKAFSIMLLAF